jgi:hypothetical protein
MELNEVYAASMLAVVLVPLENTVVILGLDLLRLSSDAQEIVSRFIKREEYALDGMWLGLTLMRRPRLRIRTPYGRRLSWPIVLVLISVSRISRTSRVRINHTSCDIFITWFGLDVSILLQITHEGIALFSVLHDIVWSLRVSSMRREFVRVEWNHSVQDVGRREELFLSIRRDRCRSHFWWWNIIVWNLVLDDALSNFIECGSLLRIRWCRLGIGWIAVSSWRVGILYQPFRLGSSRS